MSGATRITAAAAEEAPPPRPESPARALQQGIGKIMAGAMAPLEAINLKIAGATDAISRALPSFPAATRGSLVIALPHSHPHPPSFGVPLPPVGMIALGCCISVLINGMPAARVGDIGFSPTCLGYFPEFEIFTGSSKVFIGGMRAARQIDVTMHCWPPKEWMARGAVAALVAAAKAAQMVMLVAGVTSQVAGIVADDADAASADDPAVAEAMALSASMGAAQLAADAVAMAAGMLMGKDPGAGLPTGMITAGHANVLIGGFPMPSGMQIAGRILQGAKRSRPRKGDNPDTDQGPKTCKGA